MGRINLNGYWTSLEKLEKEFGTVEFKSKKYYLISQAEITNRLLPYPKNYNDVFENEKFDFEMSTIAIDKIGNKYIVYWIFEDIKGDNEKELDSFDYDNVDRIELIKTCEKVDQIINILNITENQAIYIAEEMQGLNIKNLNRLSIKSTNTSNEKGEIIYQVVFDEIKHICYI